MAEMAKNTNPMLAFAEDYSFMGDPNAAPPPGVLERIFGAPALQRIGVQTTQTPPTPPTPVAKPSARTGPLSFGSLDTDRLPRMPVGMDARQQLGFSPIVEYSPEQLRIQQMAAALEGIPVPAFSEFMRAIPQRGAAPSATEQASQTYLDRALADYTKAVGSAEFAEDAQEAESNLLKALLTVMDPSSAILNQ